MIVIALQTVSLIFFNKNKHWQGIQFNSLWPIDAIWQHRTGSTIAQIMAFCLIALNHYLNQYWPPISEVLWHSPESRPPISEVLWHSPESRPPISEVLWHSPESRPPISEVLWHSPDSHYQTTTKHVPCVWFFVELYEDISARNRWAWYG